MNEIDKFKQRAKEEGICDLGINLDDCRNRKQYIDLMLGSKGLDYMCNAIYKGWGVSTSYIKENFEPYINGKYISRQAGYFSELYCEHNVDMIAKTTNLAILNCNITIDVPKIHFVYIYATNGSKITLSGSGTVVLICYGDVELINESNCKVRTINKNKDTNE